MNLLDKQLLDAARYGRTETVRLLIAQGANVNAKDDDGWTPLHLATKYDRTETARVLIEKGAKENA